MAVFGIASENANDEISNFQMGRYVNTNEALWRLSFQIHERYPTVVHLAVLLENGQRVYFTEANAAQRAERPPSTTLTSSIVMCEADPFAATLMYVEMPKYYTWNQSTKKFQRRKQGIPVPHWPQVFSTDALGRMYTVHPRNDATAVGKCTWTKIICAFENCEWPPLPNISRSMSTIGFAGERFSLGFNTCEFSCFIKCLPNTNTVRNYHHHMFPFTTNSVMEQIQRRYM